MDAGLNFLDQDTGKFLKVNEISSKGSLMTTGAEHFVQKQEGLYGMVESHRDSIAQLTKGFRGLEAQVKAIARVMATQNVQCLDETLKHGFSSLRADLLHTIDEKTSVLEAKLKEEDCAASPGGGGRLSEMMKRFDELQSKVMKNLSARQEEIALLRFDFNDKIEKISEQLTYTEGQIKVGAENMKAFVDSKVRETQKKVKDFEINMNEENTKQDAELLRVFTELKRANESMHANLMEESKDFASKFEKFDRTMTEKFKKMHDELEREPRERNNMFNNVLNHMQEKITLAKNDMEKQYHFYEANVDRKVLPASAGVAELKQAIEGERVHREESVQNLVRLLAKERQQRDNDEDRLLGMINQCMAAIQRMHKSG